ncbi:MAG: hypothetical protein ACPGVN_06700 [Alphaproteobacteria bacterium]
MKYLQAAIDLGLPADCATNGRTYEDLVRTWNRAYKPLPKRVQLEKRIAEALAEAAANINGSPLAPKSRKKWFFGLF